MKLILTYLLFLCLPVLTGNQYVHASIPAKKHTSAHQKEKIVQHRPSVEYVSVLNDEDLLEFSLFNDDNEDDEIESIRKKSSHSFSSSPFNLAVFSGTLSACLHSYSQSNSHTSYRPSNKYIFQRALRV